MATLTLNLPDELHAEISDAAAQLKIAPEQCVELALNHFMQAPALMSAIEAIERMDDDEPLVDFPELKEELELDIKFHPLAMEELESLTEEEQVDELQDIINRISDEDDDELIDSMDVIVKEEGDSQIILSEFSFGQVVYKIGDVITIYYVGLPEEDDEDDEDEEEEDDGEE